VARGRETLAPLPEGVPEMYRPPTPRRERQLRAWDARRVIVLRSVVIAAVVSASALSHLPGTTPAYDPKIPPVAFPSIAPFPTFEPLPTLSAPPLGRPTITPTLVFPSVPVAGDVPIAVRGSLPCTTLPDPPTCRAAVDGRAVIGNDALVAVVVEYPDARSATYERERVAVTSRIGLLPLNRTETLSRFVVSVSAEQGATASPTLSAARDRLVGQVERQLRTLS